MTSFERKTGPADQPGAQAQHNEPDHDDAADQLQRELERFAGDGDSDEEDAALLPAGDPGRPEASSGQQPQNLGHADQEINEYERYFDQQQ